MEDSDFLPHPIHFLGLQSIHPFLFLLSLSFHLILTHLVFQPLFLLLFVVFYPCIEFFFFFGRVQREGKIKTYLNPRHQTHDNRTYPHGWPNLDDNGSRCLWFSSFVLEVIFFGNLEVQLRIIIFRKNNRDKFRN